MDELQLLRDCLPEQQPPAEDVIVAARRRMSDGRRPRRVPLAGVRPARRDLLLRVGVPTAAGVAAAAALVVAVAATVPAAPAQPSAAGRTGPAYTSYSGALPAANADSSADGRAILLTAAMQVAKETQPVPEKYWVTSGTAGDFLRVGPAADRYTVLDESEVQYWANRSPKTFSVWLAQQLGAAPVSAADRAAWQRDGSPTVWKNVQQSNGLDDAQGYSNGGGPPLTMAAGRVLNDGAALGSQQFQVGDHTFTLAQLQALPADPAKLEKLLLSGYKESVFHETPGAFLLDGVLPPVLAEPVTPAVRGALYTLLAGLPGIKSLGEVTDPAGQRGEAVSDTASYRNCGGTPTLGANGSVSFSVLFSSCTTQEILILNPKTGWPLAEELRYVGLPTGQRWTAPDRLFSYEIFGQSHWTNANPPKTPSHP
jgi:hypothetical protein